MPMQFTVRIENQPGALARLAETLAENGVDIRSIGASVVGSAGYTVLMTNDDARAEQVLRAQNYEFQEGEAVTAFIEDRPGALAHTARQLADAGVNIHGVLLLGRHQGKAELSFSVDHVARARRALGVF